MTRRVGSLLSFVLHITFAVRLCLCLRLRLAWRPARSWVQRAEVSRRFLGSLLLLGKSSFSFSFFFCTPSFLVVCLESFFSAVRRPGRAAVFFFFFFFLAFTFWVSAQGFSGTARRFRCAAWKWRQRAVCFVCLFFLFVLRLVQELFFSPPFFLLLCFLSPSSTQYNVRGLKTM